MEKKIEWKEIPGMNIQSDRDAEKDEKICAFVINPATDEILENNLFIPDDTDTGHYSWPKKFAEKINKTSNYICAGEMDANGDVTPLGSQYRNKLWKSASANLTVYPTNCCLDCWKEGGSISSTGPILPGMKIIILIKSKNHNLLYETLTFISDIKTASIYSWPYYLSVYINKNSLFLRAGEKDQETKLITPLYSSYRNKIWFPNGSNHTYDMSFEANDNIKNDAMMVYNNALTMLTKSVNPPSKDKVDAWLQNFSQGKFSDITYPQTNAGSNTTPLYIHLGRVKDIANYIHQNNISQQDRYYTSAIEALHFYTSQDYKTSNWWDRQIGLAKIVSESLILLVVQYTSSSLNDCIDYLKKTTNTTMGQAGANQADFAYIQLFWAISGWKNTSLASFLNETYAATDAISSLCFPVARHGKEDGEGISVDDSFSQHNPQSGKYSQLYAGTYGAVLLSDIFKIQSILYGAFSLSKDAIRSLENFIINGMGWFIYARFYDFHVCGRGISRGMYDSTALAGWCGQLMNGDPTYPAILQEVIRRASGDEGSNNYYQGCRAYWVNDYMAQFSGEYCLWAKVISTRTVGGESGNGENLKGYYIGCGSYFITRTGKEYYNIQPIWEWQHIPGTTIEQIANFNYPLIDWGYNNWGSDDFSGVMSDGRTGIASMILTRKNVKHAKKSIIALPDKSIFIGSSIDISATNGAVHTCVNQCILNGNVQIFYNDGTEEVIKLGQRRTSNKINKIIHDGLRYNFFDTQTITVQTSTQTGSWHDINKGGSSDVLSGNIFSIWIEHNKGNAAFYYYEITNSEGSATKSDTQAIHSDSAHVVTDLEQKYAAAIIFTSSGYEVALSSVKIKALNPIAFIATLRDDKILAITIADLTQKLTKADFFFTWGEVSSLRSFPLPDADHRGESITYLVAPPSNDNK